LVVVSPNALKGDPKLDIPNMSVASLDSNVFIFPGIEANLIEHTFFITYSAKPRDNFSSSGSVQVRLFRHPI